MFRAFTIAFASLGLTPFFAACSAATESDPADAEIPGTRISEEALKGGCRVICPKCKPGQPCPKMACYIECPPNKQPCGDSFCTGGQVCCNASCGICTDPGGFCTQQYCEPTGCNVIGLCVEGYTWDSVKCECVPTPTCTQIGLCIEGYVWSDQECACVPSAPPESCTTDADCHLVDDYCDGCNCYALSAGQPPPVCNGTIVNCFAQPCMNKAAACVSGQCTVVSGVTQ